MNVGLIFFFPLVHIEYVQNAFALMQITSFQELFFTNCVILAVIPICTYKKNGSVV